MERTPAEMLEFARCAFETRKADWRRMGAFHVNAPKETVELRFAVLRRAMDWSNWCEGYVAVSGLVATWEAEDAWERTVQAQIDPEGDGPEELFGLPDDGILRLDGDTRGASDSSSGQVPVRRGPVDFDAHSAAPAASAAESSNWNWDQEGGWWRHAPKLGRHPSRKRAVIMQSDTVAGWACCGGQLAEGILQFYDNAALYRMLQNVAGLGNPSWGIRFEGGVYLTLRDANFQVNRELRVVNVNARRRSS